MIKNVVKVNHERSVEAREGHQECDVFWLWLT